MPNPMGPCPACGRHVVATAKDCPFCGRRFFLSAAAGAAALLLVPDVAGGQAEPEYGVPRMASPVEEAAARWTWSSCWATWRAGLGLARPFEAWNRLEVGEGAMFAARDLREKSPSRGNANLLFQLAVKERGKLRFGASSSGPLDPTFEIESDGKIPEDATVTGGVTSEVKVGDKVFACDVKSYEWVGNELKVHWCKDAPGGFVIAERGGETVKLVAVEEKVQAANREWACSVWEIEAGGTRVREWRCAEAPGGIVKWEERAKDGDALLRSVVLTRVVKR